MAKQNPPAAKQSLEEQLTAQLSSKLGPSAVDPIEAAKVGGEAGAVSPTPAAADEPAAAEEPVLAEPAPTRTADVYVVERDITVSWGTQTLRLKAGAELSEDSYGDGAIERFRERGVALKPKA